MNLNQLIHLKKYDEAIKECKILISDKNQETRLTGIVYLGIVYTQQNKFKESRETFDNNYKLIINGCSNYWSGKELIETFVYFNELEKADFYLNAYLDKNPKDFNALFNKCKIFYLQNNFRKALDIAEIALLLKTDNHQLLYLSGLICNYLEKQQEAFYYFEKSFENGNDKAINEILKILFKRTGSCDYINCTDCCCINVSLNGINGNPVKTEIAFNSLLIKDQRNNCWQKDRTNKNGNWVFKCLQHGQNNSCKAYDKRPDICREYPASILSLRKACSYTFELNKDTIKFKSKDTFNVVLHILKAYGYTEEAKILLDVNFL